MVRTQTRDNLGPVFDCDNHFWESSDAFTRYRDPKFRDRGLQVKEVEGVLRYVINDKFHPMLPGPADVHPRLNPGSLLGLFSGKVKATEFKSKFDVDPASHPEWYNRDKRLAVMDDQGIETTWMFPSQAVMVEAHMSDDLDAAIEIMRAFNRWIDDEWGFAYQERIFATPYMTLSDPDLAVKELEWCLQRGARVVQLRHGPAITRDGTKSPAHPMFDRFWGLVQEAGITVASHGTEDHSYKEFFDLLQRTYGERADGSTSTSGSMRYEEGSPFEAMTKGRQVHDYAFILIAHRLFERFPGLQYAFVETGSAWVPSVLHALDTLGHFGDFTVSPRQQFIEHCSVVPYPEEDVADLARYLPADRILFGSDWPHGEGFEHPLDFFANLSAFSDIDVSNIMRENARKLTFA